MMNQIKKNSHSTTLLQTNSRINKNNRFIKLKQDIRVEVKNISCIV